MDLCGFRFFPDREESFRKFVSTSREARAYKQRIEEIYAMMAHEDEEYEACVACAEDTSEEWHILLEWEQAEQRYLYEIKQLEMMILDAFAYHADDDNEHGFIDPGPIPYDVRFL